MGTEPIVLCASGFKRGGPQPPGEIVWCTWWTHFLREGVRERPDFVQLTMADLRLYEFSKMLRDQVPDRSYIWWDYPNLAMDSADPERARAAFVTFAELLRFAREVRPDLRHMAWGYPLNLGTIGIAHGGLTGWGSRQRRMREAWPEAKALYELLDVACVVGYVNHRDIRAAGDYMIVATQWARDLGNLPVFVAFWDHRRFGYPDDDAKLDPAELISANDWRCYCQRIRSLLRRGDGVIDWGANGPYDPTSEHRIIVAETFQDTKAS